ncbi:hypothetical protein JOF56_004848 [Kibdelosporangium banguiense]|uniref:ER-bound oxygenase mpaB/mpaB'/Rubber oxygenase catalytic domain-containing protein n=1 Tax=Kibdelosporangium banguiense TaxID=1365924 RepID=A0ABS4TJ78_9PSEU|nr:oxygenase MpaB family protein [Kibdelosporangium banguiense]MBP2324463.1 hypothetical protein [Kibdelosporangium banguiense]
MRETPPLRFRQTEPLNRLLGRPLRLLTRQDTPDAALLDTIGRQLMARDETGAALARAMRTASPGHPDRVTMKQFSRAIAGGIDRVPDAPQPLRDFFTVVDTVPDWVDFDLVNEGGQAFRRFGRNAADVLLQLALIGSYRFGGAPDLLVETGGLTGAAAQRRLAETQHWAVAIAGPDAMRRHGVGFKLTVHVRLMHALINHRFETSGRWNIDQWGLPINQADQAATLGLFNAVSLLGVRLLGVRVTPAESRAVMHLWRYVGWLMGVDEDWLCDSERRQHRLNYHLLLTQSYGTPAGPPLAKAIVDAQRTLHFGRLAGLRGEYARARLLSMLSFFLGRKGMRDLHLPFTLPWAIPPLFAVNILRYHILGRTTAGRHYLQRHGDRSIRKLLHQYFGEDVPDIGDLRV